MKTNKIKHEMKTKKKLKILQKFKISLHLKCPARPLNVITFQYDSHLFLCSNKPSDCYLNFRKLFKNRCKNFIKVSCYMLFT